MLGLGLDNHGRTTKNAHRRIYSLWPGHPKSLLVLSIAVEYSLLVLWTVRTSQLDVTSSVPPMKCALHLVVSTVLWRINPTFLVLDLGPGELGLLPRQLRPLHPRLQKALSFPPSGNLTLKAVLQVYNRHHMRNKKTLWSPTCSPLSFLNVKQKSATAKGVFEEEVNSLVQLKDRYALNVATFVADLIFHTYILTQVFLFCNAFTMPFCGSNSPKGAKSFVLIEPIASLLLLGSVHCNQRVALSTRRLSRFCAYLPWLRLPLLCTIFFLSKNQISHPKCQYHAQLVACGLLTRSFTFLMCFPSKNCAVLLGC
jgi:phosphoribosyl-ATP pyrophosphohydrolase